jgi:hypothetical protein
MILGETSNPSDLVLPLQGKTAIGILNTILVFLFVHNTFDGVPLDRLSRHPLEHVLGFLRHSVHDVNTFTGMLTATANSIIVKECYRQLGIATHIRTRASNSGAKYIQVSRGWSAFRNWSSKT